MMLRVFTVAAVFAVATPNTANSTPITIGYFGESLTHPGINGGIEWVPLRRGPISLMLAAESGFYVHPQNHSALFAQGIVGFRAKASFGLTGTLTLGSGYLHTFRGGDVYNDRGERILDLGRPNFMPSAGLEGSWTVAAIGRWAVSPFLRLFLFGQFPYNDGLLMRGAIIIGARLE